MLIDSPILTDADRAAWDRLEAYDRQIGPTTDRLAAQAVDEIRAFHAAHPDAVVSTSWGKDSVVVAHLAHLADPGIPLLWVPTIRADGLSYETADTYTTRDTYLAQHPGQAYQERPVVARNPKRGDPGFDPTQFDRPDYRSQDVLREAIGEPYVSGVRAEESRVRAMSIAHRGTTTVRTCRPIGRWSAVQVFAYLTHHNLPVHPAYAATYGGRLDRRWLRVHPLRSRPPARSAVHAWDMQQWEDDHWPRLTPHLGP